MAISIKIYIDSSLSRKEGRKMLVVFASSSSKYRKHGNTREKEEHARKIRFFFLTCKSAEMNVAAKKTKGEKKNLNPKYKYPKHLLQKGKLDDSPLVFA